MDFGVGFGQYLAQLFKNYQSNNQLQMTLMGIKWACHPSKQCLLGPRTKNEVIQGQWFGPSDGFLPHEFWCGLWTISCPTFHTLPVKYQLQKTL
jgi:hypothetical protein